MGSSPCGTVPEWKILDTLPEGTDGWDHTAFDDEEDFNSCVRRWATTAEKLEHFHQLKEACDDNLIEVGKALEILCDERRAPDEVEFLVAGLIPKSCVTLLLGAKGVGKGATLLELACDTAMRRQTWHGFTLDAGNGFAVYLFGEDPPEEIQRRVRLLCDGGRPNLLRLVPYNGMAIEDVLAGLEHTNVSFLGVDPARKFLRGDEDGSEGTSTFFTALEEFARRKRAAVVVAHHLKRGSAPRSIHDIPACMRGSQVFLDRPRVVLALHRSGDETQFGIAAPNGQPLHNLDVGVMSRDVLRLRRDEATFRHVAVAPPLRKPRTDTAGADRVHSALARLVGEGIRVTRTGAGSLFQLDAPETEGMSRGAIDKALRGLEQEGLVVGDAVGVLTLANAL
jgi:hypothetical protein